MELFAFYVEKLTLLTMLAIPQMVAILYITARVAELVDAVDLKSIDPRSCGFDPRPSYHYTKAPIAQTGESACLISVRTWVQFPLGVLLMRL